MFFIRRTSAAQRT
ncbi:hypothetical protein E2C01_071418 [Portunus trituberculatus]|uniref:Uncharacterized protein n=1 Tax=Portunus trituberculatus TaxID=210409 RepID=A0A5B7HVB2_PORTR|nr:hypothetical protein [Portunus trituberculatus]